MIMSLPVKVVTNSVPASYVPPDDMQGVLQAIAQFTSYSLDDSGPSVTINSNAAGAALNGIWVEMFNHQLGAPVLKTGYRNNWWPSYTGKPGEVRPYIGVTTPFFDASGLGTYGSGWEGWALCNGKNGTFPLDQLGRFVIPGYRYDSSSGYWITNVNFDTFDRASEAGNQSFKIELYNLPEIVLRLNVTDFYKWARNGGELWNIRDPGPTGDGNQAPYFYPLDNWQYMHQIPVSRIPPYIAVGYVQFVGYR